MGEGTMALLTPSFVSYQGISQPVRGALTIFADDDSSLQGWVQPLR